MSLRSSAGAAGRAYIPGLPSGGGIFAPRSTWPGRPSPLPPTSRGAAILAATINRPLTQRDRGQLAAARVLSAGRVGRVTRADMLPLTQAMQTRTVAPIVPRRPDRGFRVPYNIPRTPGSRAADVADAGDQGDPDQGGCTDCG